MPAPAPVLCDLDGVIWLAHVPIPGSVQAVARLRGAGHRVLFVTNNSTATVAASEAALERIGVHAAGDVLTSATAAARLIEPGERVLVVGEEGLREAVEGREAVPIDPATIDEAIASGEVDAVLVGMCRHFTYELLRQGASAVRSGARLIASNDDATYPTPSGEVPGGGSIVAAIRTAAGAEPTIAGKPHEAMAELVREALGADTAAAVMVGDRPDTDGSFARRLGCRYALVRSGVTPAGDEVLPAPEFDVRDLAELAHFLIAGEHPPHAPSNRVGTLSVMADNLIKRLLDAGVQFTETSRDRAESLVRELSDSGEMRRKDAERIVNDLVERGRESTEQFIATVRREVAKQMDLMAERMDDVEGRLDDLAKKIGMGTRSGRSAKKAPAKKAPAKKAPAKKAPAKKAPAKKAPAKKAPAKKAPAKKAPARKAPAKKAPARKAPAKKAAAR